jgi:hypothetical protein
MGPYNLMTQLERRAHVQQLLDKELSDWARNYWTRVYNTIAMDEPRYIARVTQVYKEHSTWSL